MIKIRVFIVDDHALLRDGIRALLDLHDDIEIIGEAADGREAIEKARELAPDVAVMDIAMPEMDGLEATRRIRKSSPKVKVLILSQYDDREYMLFCIQAGAEGYVPKRAVGSELVSAIRAVHRGESFLSTHLSTVVVKHLRHQAEETKLHDRLTAREREILQLITSGHKSREIAVILSISLKTVLNHRMAAMNKLNIHSPVELIKYAIKNRLMNNEE